MINGINYIQIDNNNVTEIISDIETPAFGYPKKLIIAKNTELFQKAKRGKKSADEIDSKNKAKKDKKKQDKESSNSNSDSPPPPPDTKDIDNKE